MNPLRTCLLGAAIVALAACSKPEPPPDTRSTQPSAAMQAAKAAAAQAASDPTSKMARAVGNGKPGSSAEIRYDVRDKPRVGAPIGIDVALVPGPDVEAMTARFSGMEGLTLSGDTDVKVDNPEASKPYMHRISATARTAGVYYVTVSVTTTLRGQTLGRTFSIPLAVGDLAQLQKPAAPPARDATGQAIEPMKAAETH